MIMKEIIKNNLMKLNSNGKGKYHVEIEFKTLEEAQDMHRKLIDVRQRHTVNFNSYDKYKLEA